MLKNYFCHEKIKDLKTKSQLNVVHVDIYVNRKKGAHNESEVKTYKHFCNQHKSSTTSQQNYLIVTELGGVIIIFTELCACLKMFFLQKCSIYRKGENGQ